MSIGITMIGGSGTGKTCYLYAMANQMALGVNNFTFAETDFIRGGELLDGWAKIEDGFWPQGTDMSSDYEFTCQYALRTFATFTWHDYRGGLITSQGEQGNNADLDDLFAKFHESSCLIICIASESLQGLLHGDHKAIRLFTTYMRWLGLYSNTHKTTIPVVFAITKGDLLVVNDTTNEFADGVKILKEKIFAPLFAYDRNGGWLVTFVAVGLGRGPLKNNQGQVTGCIDPFNIHLPVLFAVRCYLVSLLQTKRDELNDLDGIIHTNKSNLQSEQGKSAWSRFWNGDNRTNIEEELGQHSSSRGQLARDITGVEDDLYKITQELLISDTALVYCNGQEMTL